MLDQFFYTLQCVALALLVSLIGLYVVALIRRNNSIIDVAWGPGFIIAALVALWVGQLTTGFVVTRQIVVTLLVAVWGFRLGFHIYLRNWGRQEDVRYMAQRERWGQYAWFRAFFQVFILQGILLMGIALPVLLVNTFGGGAWSALDWVGVSVWFIGFCWEVIADHQLVRFTHNPANRGHVLRTGLWRFSRHPNYFGEATQWWGIWLIALSVPGGWLTVIGPLLITFLLLKVSGVPLLESRQRRSGEFREYAKHTNAFLPGLSKK